MGELANDELDTGNKASNSSVHIFSTGEGVHETWIEDTVKGGSV